METIKKATPTRAVLGRPLIHPGACHLLTACLCSGRCAPSGATPTFGFVTALAERRKCRDNPAAPHHQTSQTRKSLEAIAPTPPRKALLAHKNKKQATIATRPKDHLLKVRHISQAELEAFVSTGEADRKAFQNSLQELKREQLQVVQYRLSTAPTPEGLAASKPLRDLVEELGFECMRECVEFERPGNLVSLKAIDRLTFRAREEVGESAFSAAFAQAFQDSLDADFQKGYAEHGPQRVVSEYLSLCPETDDRHTWFSELAYDAKNDLVGVIMSLSKKRKKTRKGHSIGCIYTLGVVPEKRGQGYVNDLLARGTHILEREGADCIRSTTAATNFPMANAFERAHYKQTEHWWGFEIHLNSKT